MWKPLLFFVLLLQVSPSFALPPDSAALDPQRELLRALFDHISSSVNGRSCDLKPASGSLRVSDLVFSYVLWSAQAARQGVKRVPGLGCSQGGGGAPQELECYLVAGEEIRLPGEPEGWSRTLLFKFNPRSKKVIPGTFRCVDVP